MRLGVADAYTASKVSSCISFSSSIFEMGIWEVYLFVMGLEINDHQRRVVSDGSWASFEKLSSG